MANIELSCAAESPARGEPQQPTLTRIRDAPKATTPTICYVPFNLYGSFFRALGRLGNMIIASKLFRFPFRV
jgi:hypothetical protein